MDNEALLRDLQLIFFEKTQETIAIFDSEFRFIFANKALLSTLSIEKDQLIGRHISEISPGIQNTRRYRVYQEVLRTGESQSLDSSTVTSSIGHYVARIHVFKIGDGIGVSAMDITDLEDAIDELETFIYKASHDMRAPISSILGLLNIAALDMNHNSPVAKYFPMIREQTERMDKMLAQLHQTARIRKGKMVIHPINFSQFIARMKSILIYSEGFEQLKFIEDLQVNEPFYSDKALLTHLFINLMDNSIKYRRENITNSYLRIHITDISKGVRIIFEDNGSGIPMEYHQDVFRMFFRANIHSDGSGLGLYTVKHCLKKLGGSLIMDSIENKGTKFTILLPNAHVQKKTEEKKIQV